MEQKKWKLLELYPEFKNKDIIQKLSDKKIRYNIIMEGFIKVDMTDEESEDLSSMAFIHHDIQKQNF